MSRRDGRLWCISLPAFAALLAAHLESFGFGFTGLLALLTIDVATIGLLALFYGLVRWRRGWSLFGAHLLVVPILAAFLGGLIARHQQKSSIARGEEIVAALSSYRAAAGRYPASLAELVPGYLPAVPTTTMGVIRRVPFAYGVDPLQGYFLNFPAPAWVVCHRTDQTPWACDD